MDASTIPAAWQALKATKEILSAIISTKTAIAADLRIAEALDHLGRVQDTLFELRGELGDLQAANAALKKQISEHDKWEQESAMLKRVQAPGGAIVYQAQQDPTFYACPRCFADHKVMPLQDRKVAAGFFDCPGCDKHYPVDTPTHSMTSPLTARGDW